MIEFTPFVFAGGLLGVNWEGGEPRSGLTTFCALMTSSETLDNVVEELLELSDGTEDIDPEAV